MKIYHNPRCGKSRQTLKLINDAGKQVEIIEYLNTPPSFDELKAIIKPRIVIRIVKLGQKAIENSEIDSKSPLSIFAFSC